jgi:glycosyltransferase involved in cell wall biosynthesis
VNQASGLLVRSGDVAAFARAAEQLIEDDLLRAALAENSRTRAESFSADKMTRGTEKVYYKLVSGSGNRS